MPYIKKTYKAGPVVEVVKTFCTNRGKGKKRKARGNPTPEAMQRLNDRNAEMNLRHLLLCNFKPGDLHLVLTYQKEKRPEAEEGKKQVRKFLRVLRGYLRKEEKAELLYIAVTEEKKSIHHHLVLPYVEHKVLQRLWPHGTARPTLIKDGNHLINLAAYLIKETQASYNSAGKKQRRWTASQNLAKPVVLVEEVKAGSWRWQVKPKKGYYLDKTVAADGVLRYENPVTQSECQFYRLVRLEAFAYMNSDGLLHETG